MMNLNYSGTSGRPTPQSLSQLGVWAGCVLAGYGPLVVSVASTGKVPIYAVDEKGTIKEVRMLTITGRRRLVLT